MVLFQKTLSHKIFWIGIYKRFRKHSFVTVTTFEQLRIIYAESCVASPALTVTSLSYLSSLLYFVALLSARVSTRALEWKDYKLKTRIF